MKLLLTFSLSIVACLTLAQDSISRHAFSVNLYSGVPFQQIHESNEWYLPNLDIGVTGSYSVRLKNRFFISLGVGLNHQEYRSEPYKRSWTTYEYSPIIGYYNVQNHEDEIDRQTLGKFVRIRVPLLLEYMPIGKWTPYAKTGLVLDVLTKGRSSDVYAATSIELPSLEQSYTSVYADQIQLSASASGGIKYQSQKVELLFGLSSQFRLTNFRNYAGTTNNASIVGEFSIRRTIAHTKFPHQVAIKIDPQKEIKKNYLYIEGLGSVPWASLNYERSLFRFGKNRLHARVGLSAQKSGGGIVVHPPVGLTWIYGRKHGLEVGTEFIHTLGSHQYFYTTYHFGYRIETNQNLLLRFNVTGESSRNNRFSVRPGVAVGFRF